MLNLIKRIWQNGEVVNAEKMNTISSDLDAIESEVNGFSSGVVRGDIAQTAQTDAWRKQARENIQAGGTNPNLLDNWWFGAGVINQRGQNSYPFAVGYTIDRWKIRTPWGTIQSTVTVESDYVRLAVNALPDYPSAYNALNQIFESKLISGKIYTASIKVRAVTGDCSLQVMNGNYTVASVPVSGSGIFSITFTSTGVEDRIAILATVGCSIDVESVKLELGSISTLANDAPPDIATELAKCQRYCVVLDNSTNRAIGFGYATGTGSARVLFPMPVSMRNVTSVSMGQPLKLLYDGTTISSVSNVSAISVSETFSNGVICNLTVDSITYGVLCIVLGASAVSGSKIIFSADL